LALEVPTAWGATENQRGNSRPDPASGTRKSRLGGAENPRRTLEARLRSLRKERGGTIFTPYRAAGRSGQERGLRFFAITAKPSSAWTCLPCQRRRSECCIAIS
jgi:hypothetical protein